MRSVSNQSTLQGWHVVNVARSERLCLQQVSDSAEAGILN